MAKKKNSGPKKYRSAEPFKGYKKDWQPDSRTMTNAEYKGYMNTNPYQERPAQSLVQGNLIDYLMQKRKQREASEQNTKTWRDRTVSGQNSGNPYQSYQEKMKIDTHGGVSGGGLDYLQKDYEKEYKNKQAEQRTKAWQDMARTAPEMTYAMKMINDTAPSKEDQKDFGKDANQVRWDRFVNQMLGANYADVAKGIQSSKAKGGIQTEYDLYKEWKDAQQGGQQTGNGDIFGRITPQEYNQFRNWMIKNGATGIYDNGINPSLMTDKGLQSNITNWGNNAQELKRQAEEKNQQMLSVQPGQMFGEVFDLVESIAQQQAKRAAMNGNNSQEEYAKNAAALDERRKTAGARRQDIVEKADNYFTNEYDRHLYDGDDQETTRAGVFNRIMQGEVTYDMLAKSLNPEQKAALDQRLDAVIDRANNYSAEDLPDRYQYEIGADLTMSNAYDSYVKKGEAEQKKREKQKWYEDLVESKYVTESGTYDPSLLPEEKIIRNRIWSAIDKSYYWANNPTEGGIGATHKEYFMTPKQLDTFNRMYAHDKANGTNLAENYLAGLDYYLNTCKVQYEEFHARQTADVPGLGSVAHVMTFPMNVVSGVVGAGASLAALAGNKEAGDESSELYAGTRLVQNIRDERGNVVSDLAGQAFGQTGKDITKQLMNIADSIGDNLMAMATAGAVTGNAASKLGKVLIQGIMSSEAMSNTMVQDLHKGMDPTKAALHAIFDGAIEALTEHFSLEEILKPDIKGMLGNAAARRAYLLKSTIAEGSEELASGLLNTAVDTIINSGENDMPEMMERYNELIVGQGMSDREATRQVLQEHWTQLGLETLAGALSGYAMAGGHYLTSKVTQSRTGEQISNNQGEQGINTLINQAMEGNKNSEAYQQAEKLKTKLDNGQKITNREAGRLAMMLQAEASENIQNAIEAQKNPNKPGVAPSVIDRSIRALDSVADITGEYQRAGKNTVSVSRHMATVEDANSAQGERVEGTNGIILQTDNGNVNGRLINLVTTTETDENGKQQQVLKYRVEVNGEEMLAEPSQILARNLGTAWVITQQENNPNFYSTDYTNRLLKEMEYGHVSNPAVFVQQADLIRYAAFENLDMPKTQLEQKTAERLYNLARAEYITQRAAETSERTALKPGQGIAEYKGVQYGTAKWDTTLEGMDADTKEWMNTWGAVAKAAGVRVEFTDGAGMLSSNPDYQGDTRMLYGAESRNGIQINIEGRNFTTDPETGKPVAGEKHAMGVTFSHEFMHFLQRNTRNGYDNLAKYVMEMQREALGQQGLNDRIQTIMQRRNLDLAGAISELVADSCDQIFSNEKVINHIAETNQSLYNNIKGFVKNLMDKVRTAIGSMRNSISRDALRIMNKNMSRLADLFNLAWDEAMSDEMDYSEEEYRKAQELLQEAMENPVERFSFAEPVEMREDGLIAVHNLSIENLRDVLRMNGFPMPSIAVLSAEKVFQGYGGYEKASIFFGRDVVDPMLRSWNRIYNGDAYTPTFGSEQVDTADEGLQYLRKTWDRNLYQAYDMTNMFTDFKKVSNLEEARKKAYTYKQDMYEHNKERHAVRDMEKQIMKDARKLLADVYGERYQEKDTAINHWIARGVLYAAEQMEQLGELSKTAQYEILQENIDKSFEEGHISYKADFGINGTDIYDQMLEFIEAASKLEHSAMWLEAKPDGIVGIPEIQTILLPAKVKNTDIPQLLENAGLDPERIRYYDSPLGMEEGSLYYESQQIPQYVPGTRFSQAEDVVPYEETAKGRERRLFLQGEQIRHDIRKWKVKDQITLGQFKEMIKGHMYDALDQWIHNAVSDDDDTKIWRSQVEKFLTNDARKIREGSDSLIEGWNKLIKSGEKIYELNLGNVNKDIHLPTTDSISEELFGNKKGSKEYDNKDTESKIALDYKTIDETFEWCNYTHVPPYVTKAVLENMPVLIENAKYIGSHINYANYKGQVHYYVSNIKINNNRRNVVFAVHDKTNINQNYNERAYIAEVYVIKQKQGKLQAPKSPHGLNSHVNGFQELPQTNTLPNSIEEVLQNVKTDRLRSFEKEKLKGKGFKVNGNRFSMSDAVEETRDLIAYHNLSADQLMKVIRLGGFAMPSIAITRDNYVNDRYGDISVVFRKETIDPKANKANKVYGGDAWTPVYPTIEYKINDKKINAILKKVNQLIPEGRRARNVELYADNVQTNVNRNNGDIVKAVKNITNLMAAYLTEKGVNVNYPMREKRLDGFGKFSNEQVKRAYSVIGDDVIREAYEEGNTYQYLKNHPELVEKIRDELNAQWKEELKDKISKETRMKLLDKALYTEDNFGPSAASNIIEAAYKYMKQGVREELDEYALKDALTEQIDEKEYEKWLAELFDGAIEKSGIRNNKDYFTYSGNARSWEALHDPETLENVVRIMKSKADKGADTFFGQSAMLALGTKDFKSIDEIRANKGQLQHISDEELSAAKEEIVNRFGQLMDDLADTERESNIFIARDRVLEAMVDAVRTTRTADGIKRVMGQWQYNISNEQAHEIVDLLEEISNLPTEYFEAKPQRPVGLGEIATVYVTDGVDPKLLELMDENNIKYDFYDGTTEDRLAKLNSDDSVKFSQWTEEGMDVNQWMMSQTPSSLQTEDEVALVQAYKDLRIKLALSTHRIEQYEQRIKRLEAKADLTAEERDELMANRNRLEIQRKKLADLEDELYRVTSTDGYAGMMYRQNMVLKDYIQGKTQDQVRQTVEEMQKQVQKAQEQIRKDTEELKKLANTQAVKTMKSFMGKTSLSRMASLLRKNYNSSLSKAEIEDRLAEMALKQQSGQDITTDTEALAQDLLDRMRGIGSDELQYLRGATLRIGDDMLTEYVKERKIDQQVKKGKNATDESVMRREKQIALREMKEQIKGSGIKLIAEEGSSSFVQQWNELRENNGGLKDLTGVMNEMDALHQVLDYIQGEVENSRGINQNGISFDEVALVVRAAVGNVTTFLSGDPEARKQINNLMGQIAELSGRTEEIADRMEDLNRQMNEVVLAGQKAKGWTTVLQRDVKEAIKYYNKTAKVAAENERTKVRKQLIEQLRSENTRKLIEQEEKFKERMKNDKTARELANDNLMLRRKIMTVTKRLATLLTKETDLKNIPEKAKPLARQMIRMIVNHDLSYRMITFGGREGLGSIIKTLDILDAREGKFRDEDLDWLIRGEGETADYDVRDAVILALIDIESGLMEYRNAEGRGNTSLLDRKNALAKVQKATATIYNVIHASQVAEINGRQMMVMDLALDTLSDMGSSRFKGEHTGWFGRKIGAVRSGIGYKNMTPEYFIRNLKNKTLSRMYDEYHKAENKAGLMYGQAQKTLQQIAKDAGYDTWDQKKKYTIKLEKGGKAELNLEQLMQIYATWKREATLQAEIGVPEKTYHLTTGGFYVEQEAKHKINGREFFDNRAQKITEEDFYQIQNLLTDEQKRYVDRIVQYMSDDMSRLGNEASMRMYGIKKYNEKYYFPFEIWNGVKSVKSDAGAGGNTESHRGAHPSFSNRLRNNASNALMIRGFTKMAAKHIVQMINYNTFAPAIENLQRVMNSQVTTGEEDNLTARNLWAAFGERYGKDALNYLQDFQKAINGGVNKYETTIYDKLTSLFKKNAVAGSLSVAAQQPLSYIRAAMMISPKYLTLAMNPATYKGSMDEMMKYSGVAVIKNMGKFDMNFGQSAQDYITPEAQKGKAKAAYDWISDKSTILPQMMDAVTWTRMWTAAKLEQQALNPEMDHKSDEFMNKVAERFNEIMRMTQVYDSVMVKSPNLRSANPLVRMFTSFMAEPTLSANVLVDAAVNFKEKGGKKNLVKAIATFMASAAAQAAAKGFFGAGRSPDDRKNREENFLYKFWYNLLSEANPLGLIPGYNDVVEVLTKGEINDDAMGIIGKIPQIVQNTLKMFSGTEWSYRDIEESIGQILQLATDVPAKNLMRDFRAMMTFFGGGELIGAKTYANRPTSSAVLKYQLIDLINSQDLIGMYNTWIGEGYSSNSAYYNRIYEAEKAGDTKAAEELKEYLLQGRGAKEKAMNDAIRKKWKEDGDLSSEEKLEKQREYGLKDTGGYVLDEYRAGRIDRKEAEKLYRQENPNDSDKQVLRALDKIDWENAGNDGENYTNYTPLYAAIENNKAEEIRAAVKHMTDNGYKPEDIKKQLATKYKQAYLDASGSDKTRLKDALTKALKAAGYTADDAVKTINGWKEKKKK